MTDDRPTPESHDLQDYLESTDIIDWKTPEVRLLADVLIAGVSNYQTSPHPVLTALEWGEPGRPAVLKRQL